MQVFTELELFVDVCRFLETFIIEHGADGAIFSFVDRVTAQQL